jgi:CubicO group peptidase (beta-lactamase class C family)
MEILYTMMKRVTSHGFICGLFLLLLSCNQHTHGRPSGHQGGMRLLDSTEKRIYAQALAHFFDSLLIQTNKFSGGILVAKNGQVLYEHYSGFSDAENRQPIDAQTPFHVASTSKTFTSVAIMQLLRAGQLGLDDSLQQYFPGFPYRPLTVRHLLNHSSGLPNYAYLFPRYKWDKKRTATNTDVLHLFFTHRPALDFAPGSKFNYSNTNFVLLALIIEKISGRSYPQFISDSIFLPAGMNSSFVLHPSNAEAYQLSWDGLGRPFAFNFLDAIYGDKNVYTTCRDLLRYDSALREQKLLPRHLLEQAWAPNFLDKKYNDSIEHYGLGWRVKVFGDSLKIPYHNGWWHGNNAVFQRLVADTAVIIVTGNRFFRRVYSSARAANIFRMYYSTSADEETIEQGQSFRKKSAPPARKRRVSSRN